MNKMISQKRISMRLIGFAMMALAVVARAEGSDATDLITSAQSTITTIISAVLVSGGVILLALLGLKALPFAYRKIVAFFK